MRHRGRGDKEVEREPLRSRPLEPTGQRRGGLIDGEDETPLRDRINVLLFECGEPRERVELHDRHDGYHRGPSIRERTEQRGATQLINDHVRVEENAHTCSATSRDAPRTEDLMLTVLFLPKLSLPGNGVLRKFSSERLETTERLERCPESCDRILRQRIRVPVVAPNRAPCPGCGSPPGRHSFHTLPPYPRLTPGARCGTVAADRLDSVGELADTRC